MYFLFKLAVTSIRPHVISVVVEEKRANEEEDVIRSEANRENSDHSVGQQAHLPLSLAAQTWALAHRCKYPPVADGQHQQGQKEANAHSDKIEQGNGCLHWVGFITTIVVV